MCTPWRLASQAVAAIVPMAVRAPPPTSVQRAPKCSAIQPSSGAPIGVPPMKIAM